MKQTVLLLLGSLLALMSLADDLRITAFARNGTLIVTNTYSNGVVTLEKAASLSGPWMPEKNAFSLGPVVSMKLAAPSNTAFFRPLAVDLTGTAGAWTLSVSDIIDLPSLADRLIASASSDGVSQFVSYNLSAETEDLLFSYLGASDLVLQQALVDEFNLIIQGGPIYDAGTFAGVNLSPPTQALLAQAPRGADLVRLNRMLLEDAYPVELLKKRTWGWTNLVNSFSVLTTVAGAGGTTVSPNNKWLPEFEGGPATNALLSRPHIAMADRAGNLYIADKEAHAIRKVTTDGIIHTVAGTGDAGYGTTNAAPARSVALNNPNGIWVRADGTFFILDRDNGFIRKVDTNGIMTTLVDNGVAIPGGRGLWVSLDESILFYCAGTQLKRWDSTNGLSVFVDSFWELGNLAVDPRGRLAVTDRGVSQVYAIDGSGARTVLAGNGSSSSGGDGQLATATGLWQVRGIWFLPTGAYFLATDNGSQVWYVDTDGYIHLFLDGDFSSHAGDGSWFYDPTTPKLSKIRQITMDYDGNLIITEHDAGYVRKVQFLRHQP